MQRLDGDEKISIGLYKDYQHKYLPNVDTLADLILPNFDAEAYPGVDYVSALKTYLDDNAKYVRHLVRAAQLRQQHYEDFIRDRKDEDEGHKRWREGMNKIAEDAQEKLSYWQQIHDEKLDRLVKRQKERKEVYASAPENTQLSFYTDLNVDKSKHKTVRKTVVAPKLSKKEVEKRREEARKAREEKKRQEAQVVEDVYAKHLHALNVSKAARKIGDVYSVREYAADTTHIVKEYVEIENIVGLMVWYLISIGVRTEDDIDGYRLDLALKYGSGRAMTSQMIYDTWYALWDKQFLLVCDDNEVLGNYYLTLFEIETDYRSIDSAEILRAVTEDPAFVDMYESIHDCHYRILMFGHHIRLSMSVGLQMLFIYALNNEPNAMTARAVSSVIYMFEPHELIQECHDIVKHIEKTPQIAHGMAKINEVKRIILISYLSSFYHATLRCFDDKESAKYLILSKDPRVTEPNRNYDIVQKSMKAGRIIKMHDSKIAVKWRAKRAQIVAEMEKERK